MTMPHLSNCPHKSASWCLDCVRAMHAELATVTAQRDAWRVAAEVWYEILDVAEFDFHGDRVTFNPIRVFDNDRAFGALGAARKLELDPAVAEMEAGGGVSAKLNLLVSTLKAGLMVLVNEGIIDESRAEERARNQAQALLGVFELKQHDD